VKLRLENLPPGLQSQRQTLADCLEAMNRVMPLQAVYLFGSHARGEARADSDVDLCIVADGAERQLEAARKFREALWDVWPRPALTLIPITPHRLAEKRERKDFFSARFYRKGFCLPRKTDSNNPADWLLIAESDLQGLQSLAQQELAFSMCRSKLAEVVEKIVKAELIRLGWNLEKTHDLLKLGNELDECNSDLVETVRPLCTELAEVYFSDRYPGFDLEDPDWPEAEGTNPSGRWFADDDQDASWRELNPDALPNIVGQISLEDLDWVVDSKNQKLIPNPEDWHGGLTDEF